MNLLKKLFLASLVLGCVAEASAYTLFSEGNNTRVRQWPPASLDVAYTGSGFPDTALPAQWRLNTSGSDDVTFVVLSGIVDDVIATWNSVPGAGTLYGREADGTADLFTSDNLNSISWLETNWAATTSTPTGVLAFAAPATFGDDYQAFSDILFNGDTHTWSDAGAGGTFDIESVLAHEMGHSTGLDHTTISGATMFPSAASMGQGGTSGIRPRSLSADDIAGAQAIYGTPAGTGTLTGTIDSDIGGQAMGILAINLTTGESISALTGNGITGTPNGEYTIAGLPAGNYHVATYSIDNGAFGYGPGNVAQFSSVDTTFQTRFYNSGDSTGTANPASASTVVITSGGTTSGIDIDPPDAAITEKIYFASNSNFGPGGANLSSSGDTFDFGYSENLASAPTPVFLGPSNTTASAPSLIGTFPSPAGLFGETVGLNRTTVTSTNSTAGSLRSIAISYNGGANIDILPGAVEMDFSVGGNTAPSIAIAGNVAVTQDETITPNTNVGTVSDTEDVNSTLSVTVTNISPTPPSPSDLLVGITNTSGNVIVSSVATTCDLPADVYTITVEVEDSGTLTATDTFTVTISANPTPTLGAYAATSPVVQGTTGITVDPAAAPADANSNIATVAISPTTFAGTGSASVNAGTGQVTFNTTGATPVNTYNFTVTVTDDCGQTAVRTVSQQVTAPPNTGPTIAIAGSLNIVQDQSLTPSSNIGTVSDTEDVNSTLGVTVTGISPTPPSPTDLVVGISNSGGNVIVDSIDTTCALPANTYTITVEVEDSGTLTSTDTFDIVVSTNPTPTLGAYSTPSAITQGTTGATASPAATPADSNANIASVAINPTNFAGTGSVSVNASGVVTFNTTSLTPVNTYNFTVTVTDDCGATAMQSVSQEVTAVPNTDPTITIAGSVNVVQDQATTPGTNLGSVGDTEDAAGTLAVSVTSISPTPPSPTDLVVVVGNSGGTVSLTSVDTTCALPADTYTITVEVEDSGTLTATGTFDVVVTANPTPTLGAYSATTPVLQGATGVTASPAAAPADANSNIASVVISPTDFAGTGSVSVNSSTGEVTFNTTASTPVNTYNFTVTVTDDCGETAVQMVSQEVQMSSSVDSWLNLDN